MASRVMGVMALPLVLTACGRQQPSGQVVAIVDGEQVTAGEIRAEARARDAGTAVSESELLRDVIDRKLWAQQARRQRLDQQIDFVLAERRADEALLADMMRETVAHSERTPSQMDVRQFLAAHPDAFARETIFQIKEVEFRPTNDSGITASLANASTLEEASEILRRNGIPSQSSRTEWNSLFMSSELATKLRAATAGKIFVQRDGPNMILGTVQSRQDNLVDGRDRQILARRSIILQRSRALVDQRLHQLRTSANISYQPGTFAPSPR